MKNLFKLFGIIALAAIIGFSMIACDLLFGTDDDDEGGTPFEGTWNGTITNNGKDYEAKIVFTDTKWTLTYSTTGLTDLEGTYTYTSPTASSSTATLDNSGYNFCTAIKLSNSLTLNSFKHSSYTGATGSFTKEGADNFTGKWNGSVTDGDGRTADDAVITFATNKTWTLKSEKGEVDLAGTYTVGLLGSATLTLNGAAGNFATASVYGGNTLTFTVTSTTSEYAGASGTFLKDGYTPPSSNPFVGSWTGTMSDTTGATTHPATFTFTETEWSFTCTGLSISKTSQPYERNGSMATLEDNGYTFASPYILLGTLTISTANSGPLRGYKGSFTKD